MMSGKAETLSANQLLEAGGNVIGALIAAGCRGEDGHPLIGNKGAEAVSAGLAVGEQADLLAAILAMTIPEGPGPFVDILSKLGASINPNGAAEPAPPAMN